MEWVGTLVPAVPPWPGGNPLTSLDLDVLILQCSLRDRVAVIFERDHVCEAADVYNTLQKW